MILKKLNQIVKEKVLEKRKDFIEGDLPRKLPLEDDEEVKLEPEASVVE